MASRRRSSTVGYARVSSIPQHTQLQRDAPAQADCIRVFEDKISSRATYRPGLVKALDYLRDNNGDTLCVWKLDRLGRSVKEVLTLADDLHERGIDLRILTGRLAGTYTPTGEGKFFFTMMTAFAELERDMLTNAPWPASPLPAPKAASAAARASWTMTRSPRRPPAEPRARAQPR